jgi:predicted ATPase/DNA-binding winged helix-turn-helix (wHTH) protein
MDRPAVAADSAIAFGPFRFLPAQQLLLEDEAPVRLGSRAHDILTVLVEHAGEVVGKSELIARVWPNTFIDENTLRVHVAGLRRALGDGQPGRRYLASVPGRGYRFVAPVTVEQQDAPPRHIPETAAAPAHNLPVSRARVVGRAEVIAVLGDRLRRRPFITIVGAGGIGKTAVALAVAEALLPTYRHGVWLVDLASVGDSLSVPGAVMKALGLAIRSENQESELVDFLRDKETLVVLDSCEHVTDAAASLAEQLLAEAPGAHILATSREPLRAESERVHHLPPLRSPGESTNLTAAEALAFPAVQLFVERAAAILDGFELSDDDAPIVSDICSKLGGIALAIELAAARVDAFGVQQLGTLLDDRFHILTYGKRTAQARHQSLAAALDWSYEFLPEVERIVLCRLSVFVGAFRLESAIAVAGDDTTDVVEAVANLVAKSLVAADITGSVVRYRLLDTTRAYALQKLSARGEQEHYAQRHARHHYDLLKQFVTRWYMPSAWRPEERGIDDIRSALAWAFSPHGDASVGIALTAASIPLWLGLSLIQECRECIESALAIQVAQPTRSEHDELQLRIGICAIAPNTRPVPEDGEFFADTLALAEKLGDLPIQARTLFLWSVHLLYGGNYRETLTVAQRCCTFAAENGIVDEEMLGAAMVGNALHYLGDQINAQHRVDTLVNQPATLAHRGGIAIRLVAGSAYINILWIRGFPDQAIRRARNAIEDTEMLDNAVMLVNSLGRIGCPIALYVGDLAEAERLVAMLLDCSVKYALSPWSALAQCLKGRLLIARNDPAGLALLRTGLARLRETGFTFRYTICLAALAQGLGAFGQVAEALTAIEEALDRAGRHEERWCLPELLRIKGELLRLEPEADGSAEACFRDALDEARRQQALSWELRAATSLAKLWRDAGKTAEAEASLSSVYDRFTEGFETADLRNAKALMDELRA